eukprot:GGOE01014637.1.p1 GENE.GGOE01014637.1~~GGOE01014637.1.p1  ORF type:complete len:914 (+),score=130.02 GGOE01014637.1:54-2795(+)
MLYDSRGHPDNLRFGTYPPEALSPARLSVTEPAALPYPQSPGPWASTNDLRGWQPLPSWQHQQLISRNGPSAPPGTTSRDLRFNQLSPTPGGAMPDVRYHRTREQEPRWDSPVHEELSWPSYRNHRVTAAHYPNTRSQGRSLSPPVQVQVTVQPAWTNSEHIREERHRSLGGRQYEPLRLPIHSLTDRAVHRTISPTRSPPPMPVPVASSPSPPVAGHPAWLSSSASSSTSVPLLLSRLHSSSSPVLRHAGTAYALPAHANGQTSPYTRHRSMPLVSSRCSRTSPCSPELWSPPRPQVTPLDRLWLGSPPQLAAHPRTATAITRRSQSCSPRLLFSEEQRAPPPLPRGNPYLNYFGRRSPEPASVSSSESSESQTTTPGITTTATATTSSSTSAAASTRTPTPIAPPESTPLCRHSSPPLMSSSRGQVVPAVRSRSVPLRPLSTQLPHRPLRSASPALRPQQPPTVPRPAAYGHKPRSSLAAVTEGKQPMPTSKKVAIQRRSASTPLQPHSSPTPVRSLAHPHTLASPPSRTTCRSQPAKSSPPKARPGGRPKPPPQRVSDGRSPIPSSWPPNNVIPANPPAESTPRPVARRKPALITIPCAASISPANSPSKATHGKPQPVQTNVGSPHPRGSARGSLPASPSRASPRGSSPRSAQSPRHVLDYEKLLPPFRRGSICAWLADATVPPQDIRRQSGEGTQWKGTHLHAGTRRRTASLASESLPGRLSSQLPPRKASEDTVNIDNVQEGEEEEEEESDRDIEEYEFPPREEYTFPSRCVTQDEECPKSTGDLKALEDIEDEEFPIREDTVEEVREGLIGGPAPLQLIGPGFRSVADFLMVDSPRSTPRTRFQPEEEAAADASRLLREEFQQRLSDPVIRCNSSDFIPETPSSASPPLWRPPLAKKPSQQRMNWK